MHSPHLSARQLFASLFILFIGLLAASALSAWSGPSASAPGSNVTAPINAGTVDQVKNAGLSINALTVFGGAYIQNKLGIATSSPAVALEVNGTVKIGNAGEVCQSVTAGSIRYNSSSAKMEYCNGTVWGPFTQAASNNLTISGDTTNYNIFTQAGSPSSATTLTVTINSGVKVGSVNTNTPALVTGNFPTGSNITIVNNGTIVGAGGAGGYGSSQASGIYSGGPGSSGGSALSLSMPVTITNNGYIEGGGGGGGGGTAIGSHIVAGGGGGGGGGCGYISGTGGTGGAVGGGAGSPGTFSSGGSGGGGTAGGGTGGGCGAAGATGTVSNPVQAYYGGAGGAAGAAIITNGNTITWTTGNNGTQVLGAVQ
jgi:hypothetical protein